MAGKNPDPMEIFIERAGPAATQVGFGSIVGYCSGLAFRKVGRFAGVVLGMGYIGVQAAASSGYITVNWDKVQNDAMKPLDANNDGKLDADDAQIHWQRTKNMLTNKVPDAGGFTAGFLLGARRG